MQQIFKTTVGSTDGVLSHFSGFRRLTRVLGGILFLARLHNPSLAFSATPPPPSYSAPLAWNGSADPAVTGYVIYYGTSSGDYTNSIAVGNVTANTVPGLVGGVTYFFVITAANANGLLSAFSNEISYAPGMPTVRFQVTAVGQAVLTVNGLIGHTYNVESSKDLVTWTVIGAVTVASGGPVQFTDPNAANDPNRFYRTQDTQP
jgi:hypothetical protein